MEVDVGKTIGSNVGVARDLEGGLARANTEGDGLLLAGVDGVLGGLVEDGLDGVDAGKEVVKGLEVLPLVRRGLLAEETGSNLVADVGGYVDLEGKRKHILVDLGEGKVSSVGGRLSLLEDGLEGVESKLGLANGEVEEAHDESSVGWLVVCGKRNVNWVVVVV